MGVGQPGSARRMGRKVQRGWAWGQPGVALTTLLALLLVGITGFSTPARSEAPPAATSSTPAASVPQPPSTAPAAAPNADAGGAAQATPPADGAAEPAPPPAAAPSPAPLPPDPLLVAARTQIESSRAALTSLESALSVEGLRATDLDELRANIAGIRQPLMEQSDILSTRVSDLKSQLASLPPPPADGSAEAPLVAADRARLKSLSADFEGVLAPIRVLIERTNTIDERISARRRALFTEQLFERGESILSPNLWGEALAGVQREARALQLFSSDWSSYAEQKRGPAGALGLLALTLMVVAAVVVVGRMVRARLRTPQPPEGVIFSRSRSSLEALKVLLMEAVVAPLAVAAGLLVLHGFGLVPPRADQVTVAFAFAVLLKALGTAMARALLAPNEPWRRLLPMSDHDASVSFKYFSWATWTLAIALFLLFLHRIFFVPLALTVVTSAVMALMIAGFLARFLIYLSRNEPSDDDEADAKTRAAGKDEDEDTEKQSPRWIRFLVWILVALMVAALVGGYVSFAALVARRLVIAGIIVGVIYLLYVLVDSVFDEKQMRGSPRIRSVARVLGLSPMSVELGSIIIAGVLKVSLLALACLLLIESWGSAAGDMLDLTRGFSFAFQIGNVSISPWGVLTAIALLLIGIAIARAFQRWVTVSLLPRTRLEPSLQSSISTVVGYIGFITALMVAMSELGLSLENVALVAGALSVGIGFGLQSIVNNFVSGIILLAERPIRVGDTINVKGEEGYVRRISVRSTEIETYDRSSVIVPNSDLITGMVKNFTHANTTGRIIIAVTTPYDVDAELVRDLLVGCAYDHPQVLRTPPPRVFLQRFVQQGIGFELRCVVANVDYGGTVKSDLHFKVLERFREAGISFACEAWAATGALPSPAVEEDDGAGEESAAAQQSGGTGQVSSPATSSGKTGG